MRLHPLPVGILALLTHLGCTASSQGVPASRVAAASQISGAVGANEVRVQGSPVRPQWSVSNQSHRQRRGSGPWPRWACPWGDPVPC